MPINVMNTIQRTMTDETARRNGATARDGAMTLPVIEVTTRHD